MSTSEQELRDWAERIRESIRSGSIEHAKRATLIEYSAWLCKRESTLPFGTAAEYEQICELVRLHLLRSMMESFEERSRKMELWVMALAVAALISSVVQIFSPVLFRERPTASAPPAPATQSAAPRPDVLPSAHPLDTAPPAIQPKDVGKKP